MTEIGLEHYLFLGALLFVGRQFGFLGNPRAPVLELNLALDQMKQGGPTPR